MLYFISAKFLPIFFLTIYAVLVYVVDFMAVVFIDFLIVRGASERKSHTGALMRDVALMRFLRPVDLQAAGNEPPAFEHSLIDND